MVSKKWLALPLALMLMVPLALAKPDEDGDGRGDDARSWFGPCKAYEKAHERVAASNGTNEKFVALENESAAQNMTVSEYCALQAQPGRGVAHAAAAAAAGLARAEAARNGERVDNETDAPESSGRPEGAGRPDGAGSQADERRRGPP